MPIKKAILTAAVAPIVDRVAVTLPSVDEEKSGIPQDKQPCQKKRGRQKADTTAQKRYKRIIISLRIANNTRNFLLKPRR